MISAKEAHDLTDKIVTQNKLKALDKVEEKIKKAINEGECSITINDIFLNDDCIGVLKDNGYKLKGNKKYYVWVISW